MRILQHFCYFINSLLLGCSSVYGTLYLKFDLYLPTKPQKFSNHFFYSHPVNLWSHFQFLSYGPRRSPLKTPGSSRKKFFLWLPMRLLSCCKWDAIITSAILGCLSLKAPSTQQSLNQSPQSLWVALMLNFTCWNSHSLHIALLILSFIHQLHFVIFLIVNFPDVILIVIDWLFLPWGWSIQHHLYCSPKCIYYSCYVLLHTSGCDSWSTSFITSKLEFKLDTREKIKPLGL